ncbi:MAG: nicotinamide-nucleotide adenylyltransferase [Candidatus Odinarchaeia archaeon]
MVVGFIIGRFQPVHKGHIEAILSVLNKVDRLIIGVGSAQKSHFLNNPFTAGERILMLKRALDENNIEPSRYMIIPIQDINDNRLWVQHVVTLIPPIDIVFTNDPLSNYLFKAAGFKTERVKEFDRDKYSATEVRRRIREGEDWESLVPHSVADVIKSINGIERIKSITIDNLK